MPATIPRIAFLSRGALGERAPVTVPAIQRLLDLEARGKLRIGPNILPDVLPEIPPELSQSCHALVCRPTWGGKVTSELVERLRTPGQRFVVATLSAADSHIALEDASVPVIKATTGNTRQTAELTIFLAICILRRAQFSLLNMGFGVYARPDVSRTRSLKGLTWTVLGPGSIGTSVLALAEAMGVGALRGYHPGMCSEKIAQIRRDFPVVPDSVEWTSDLVAAVADADVVSIHVPLTASTRQMIGAALLAHLRPSAVLVNMARHDLVDETALINALEDNRLAGYAADVLPEHAEHHGANPYVPPVPVWRRACWDSVSSIGHCTHEASVFQDSTLAETFLSPAPSGETNLVLTPHIGGSTWDAESSVADEVIDALLTRLGIAEAP